MIESPSGPLADVPTPKANLYRSYRQWRATEDGERSWQLILRAAQTRLDRGETRISVNALVEGVRHREHIAVNNTYRAWIADDLIEHDGRLVEVIERRRRRKPKTL